MNYSPQK